MGNIHHTRRGNSCLSRFENHMAAAELLCLCGKFSEAGPEFFSLMDATLRTAGIDSLGDVPWGTHFCVFYETWEDLVEVLIPYFKAGLEQHEFCLWVAVEEAQQIMQKAFPEYEHYRARGQIEWIPHADWYFANGRFEEERVHQGWLDKLDQALSHGFSGLRFAADILIERQDWKHFARYEGSLDETLQGLQIVGVCAYHLDGYSAGSILDVVRHHQFTLARREGAWEPLEGAILQRAHEELLELNAELERRVEERTVEFTAANDQLQRELAERRRAESEKKKLFDALRLSNEQLQVLSRRLVEVQEEERKRLAREIHDDISQRLTAMMMQLGTAKSLLPKSTTPAHAILEQTEELIEKTLERTRLLIADLRPQVLDDLGLVPALRRLGDTLQENAGVEVKIKTFRLPKRLSATMEVALFRIVQEAVTNVRKHAQARHVTISLSKEFGWVVLSVQDDGIGFDNQAAQSNATGGMVLEEGWLIPAGHFGLIGIQERVAQFGGKFHITSRPGEGTTLQVELPL